MFEYHIYDEYDKEHIVEVDYDFIPYRPATHYEPAEGGCEIISVECKTKKLEQFEIDQASEACISYAYAEHRENVNGYL